MQDFKEKLDQKWYPDNFDWYIKWAATTLILASMIMRAAGPDFRLWDLGISSMGLILWLWVSVMWDDRALIILNSASILIVGSTFLREIVS